MEISILIPTMASERSLPYLSKCVEMIRKNSKFHHRIMVMVNGHDNFNPLTDLLKYGIEVFHIDTPGQCTAVNALAKEVRTGWMMVTDDDSMFMPNWERLFKNVENFDVLCMNSLESGKVGSAPPFQVHNCGMDTTDFDEEKFNGFCDQNERHIQAMSIGEGAVPILEKGFSYPFLIKTSLWTKIGGYDESYDPWGSNCDSDLFYKLTLAGITPMRDRSVLNYHFSQISGTFAPEQHSYWLRNRSYFERKWGFRRADSPDIWYHVEIPYATLAYKPDWMVQPTNANPS
jgi:glycosyltransferase involved in cell wall biosynthesis